MLVEHRGKRPTVPEVRIGGVVRVHSTVTDGAVLTTGCVAVGDQVPPPDRSEDIRAVHERLHFPGRVHGRPCGEEPAARVMPRHAAWLAAHRDGRVL